MFQVQQTTRRMKKSNHSLCPTNLQTPLHLAAPRCACKLSGISGNAILLCRLALKSDRWLMDETYTEPSTPANHELQAD